MHGRNDPYVKTNSVTCCGTGCIKPIDEHGNTDLSQTAIARMIEKQSEIKQVSAKTDSVAVKNNSSVGNDRHYSFTSTSC